MGSAARVVTLERNNKSGRCNQTAPDGTERRQRLLGLEAGWARAHVHETVRVVSQRATALVE